MPSRRPLRSLALTLLGVIAAGTLPARGEDAPERVGNLGAPDRLVIRGLESFEVEQLRRPLLADHDLLRFSVPKGSRATLLGEYARRAEQALRLTGFAEATVVPTVETIDGTEKLVLTVSEGPRFDVGKVVVHGLPDDVAARLETRLRSPAPPALACRDVVRRADGSTREVWRIADGSVATLSPALWPRSGPAPCDDATMNDVRFLVAVFLQQEGYFDITPPRDPADPAPAAIVPSDVVDPGIEATLDTRDGREATLTVSVKALPPKSWISRIDLSRGVTTTPDEMATFLGIAVGAPITTQSPVEWMNRLRDSGRFIDHQVSIQPDLLEPGGRIVRFDIVEYEPMMPLSRPLSREEETMLRCRRWLFDALDDERDLVLTIEPTDIELNWKGFEASGSANVNDPRSRVAIRTEEGESTTHRTAIPRSRVTISGSRGFSLLAEGIEGEWHGIVASTERLRFVAPRGAGWLDVPFTIPLKVYLRPNLTVTKKRVPKSTDADGNLTLKLGFDSNQQYPAVGPAGFHVTPSLPPVFCSILLHHRSPRVHWEGNDLVVRHDGQPETRIDGPTGRPRALCVLGQKVTIEERPDALAEADRKAGSVGRSRFRSDRPLSSGVRFLFAEGGLEFARSLFAPIVLGDQGLPAYDLFADRIARLARQLDDDDALAAIDGVVWRGFAPCPTEPQSSDLLLPRHDRSALGDHVGVGKPLAVAVWRSVERRLAPDAWPMILVRARYGPDHRIFYEEMAEFMASESPGPLACLVAATVSPDVKLAAALARRGLEHADRDRFLADCRPLLDATADVDLSSLVRGVVRGIDDEPLAFLGGMLATDAGAVVAVARRLRESDVATSADMEAILAAAWDGGLGEAVVRHLRRFAAAGTEQKTSWALQGGNTKATVTIDGVTRTFSSVKLNASEDGTSFSFEAK